MASVIESPEPPMVLVRHGESTWNERRLVQGQDDRATLTSLGRQQAAEVAHELSSLEFDLIVASDLRRAMETAAIIAGMLGLDVESEPTLRERSFGVAEGGPLDQLTERMVGIKDGVVTDDDVRPDGGETLSDLRHRVGEFIAMRQRRWPTQRLLVVTHGGTIRAIQSYCAGTPFQGSQWNRIGNCSVWTVSAPQG
jgi:probable phosphoglycerate mutase